MVGWVVNVFILSSFPPHYFLELRTMSHQHDHGHGQGDHEHDDGHDHAHDHSDEIQPALQSLIWKQIEFDKIRCLNESEINAGRQVVKKQYSQRLEAEPVLESDADEQLLLFIP